MTTRHFSPRRMLPWLALACIGAAGTAVAGPIASGEYMVKSVHSGLCLDISGVSTNDGANVQQYRCWTGSMNQRFQVTDLGNGAYSFEARHSAKVLDADNRGTSNGTNVHQWSWWGGPNQQWEVRSVSGGYEIRPRHAQNLCLDVAGVSMNNAANIHLWSCHGGANQKWTFSRLDGGGSGGGGGTPVTTTVAGANFATKSTGGAGPDNSWNIWTNGYIQHTFSFANPATLTLVAKGDYAGNAWPNMVVTVGGTQVANLTVNSSTWKTYTFNVTGKTGSQAVQVRFTNDYAANGGDRNLYVRSVAVTGGGNGGGDSGGTDGGTDNGGDTPTGTPVAVNGQLRVSGVNLVNKAGQSLQLRGMSSHGLHWFGQYMNSSSVKWLRDDWKANVVRAAMYTAEGGYISNPSVKSKVIETVDAAIQHGLYVIIDWHILHDNDPNQYKAQAIEFFQEMARRYGTKPNVIYEIANEPNGNVNWNTHIRPYAMDVINAIRQIDPDNLIIVGTGTWSQDIHHAADNKLPQSNLMYTLHFYSGTHGQYLRDRIDYARSKGAAIFVTEWGSSQASGDGGVYEQDTRTWISFLNQRGISWVNWSLADKNETSAALMPGASATGGWPEHQLSPSGRLVRELMRSR